MIKARMQLLKLSEFFDEARLLTTQNASTIPFLIRRVFIISEVQKNTQRGKHAHKKTKQAIFCIQGAVTVRIDNGKKKSVYRLDTPSKGIFVDKMVWSEMYDFSPDAILMVLASGYYDEHDYIRDYHRFLELLK